MKRFGVRGQQAASEPHHYRACGLDDVYLKSGFTKKDTAFGPSVFVEDIPGLHRAIGESLISDSKPLAAREFRFLRKNMDLTQEALASRLRVDVQTVARYEKDQTAIPRATDVLLRIMFAFHIASPKERVKIAEMVRAIVQDDLLESPTQNKAFHLTDCGWQERACQPH